MAPVAEGEAWPPDRTHQEVIAPLDLSGPRPKIKDPVATFGLVDTVQLLRSDLPNGAQHLTLRNGVELQVLEGLGLL